MSSLVTQNRGLLDVFGMDLWVGKLARLSNVWHLLDLRLLYHGAVGVCCRQLV